MKHDYIAHDSRTVTDVSALVIRARQKVSFIHPRIIFPSKIQSRFGICRSATNAAENSVLALSLIESHRAVLTTRLNGKNQERFVSRHRAEKRERMD